MPLYGLIPDSPWIYGAQKAARYLRSSKSAPWWRQSKINITQITFQFKELKIYRANLYFELYHRYGMVARFLHRRVAMPIQMAAKRQVGVRTGALRSSINIKHFMAPGGAAVKIGSELHYAYLHHEGSRPHLIKPKDPDGVLIFRKGARIIRTKEVLHPGTRPNRYLSDQLRIYVPR